MNHCATSHFWGEPCSNSNYISIYMSVDMHISLNLAPGMVLIYRIVTLCYDTGVKNSLPWHTMCVRYLIGTSLVLSTVEKFSSVCGKKNQ